MNKILIIGKKSFLGANLRHKLKHHYFIVNQTFEDVFKKNENYFNQYSYVINTCIHKIYIKKRYSKKFDLDRKFIDKFKKVNFNYIFLNSRKIYKTGKNLKENSKKYPKNFYEKNKLITEKYLIKKIGKKLISLRISNVIGKRIYKNSRSNHRLFFDNFLEYKKSNKILIVKNDFKDFISIDQFCRIIHQIIMKKIIGIFNVSLSKKVFISEIVGWIDKKYIKKLKFIKSNQDSFTLSNQKLISKIDYRPTKKELKLFCNKLI